MAISGGIDRFALKPLAERTGAKANVRGTHRGPAAGLNVHNPQPGMVYKWVRHPRYDRNGAQYRRFINLGYEVVPPDAPEYRAESQNYNFAKLGLDNYQTHGDVVLVRITEDKYRELQEFREQQRKVALEGVTDSYLSKGKELESRLGESSSGKPLYYKGSDHGEHS